MQHTTFEKIQRTSYQIVDCILSACSYWFQRQGSHRSIQKCWSSESREPCCTQIWHWNRNRIQGTAGNSFFVTLNTLDKIWCDFIIYFPIVKPVWYVYILSDVNWKVNQMSLVNKLFPCEFWLPWWVNNQILYYWKCKSSDTFRVLAWKDVNHSKTKR